ncbi:MAG: putative thiolase [Dehalococcoidia bacterium]|nr:putative thiolase [Dehalococcoidia bacterium]
MVTQKGVAAKLYRSKDGLGVWEHRGKVAAVSYGYSPCDRRWDENLEHSLGAYSMIAAKKALEEAGIRLDQVDGVVSAPGPIGEPWAPRPYFAPPYDSEDGISLVTAEWLIKNMGLKNVRFANSEASRGHGQVLGMASQAIGEGLCHTCLVLFPFGNLAGRYSQAGSNARETATGNGQWSMPWGWGAAGAGFAYGFNQYCRKYGVNHDMMAPFVVNLRRNGRMNPMGYYAQHPEEPLTVEDYLASRWVVKPLCLHDADRPVNAAVCFLLTTADRAKDMKLPPVYVLNHNNNNFEARGLTHTAEEMGQFGDIHARRMYEGSGLTPSEVDIFNPYDGFTLFTQYYLDAFGWHGVKKGEALHFYQGDIRVEGPHPFLSSGGNNGTGRTRAAIFTDCIEQLQGRAGPRQVHIKAETAIAGCTMPHTCAWMAFGKYPD